MAGMMSTSKLIRYFFTYLATFGFQSSSPPDNITLNPAKNIDQSDFQTGFSIAAPATFDTEQLIHHTKTAFIDTIASFQDLDGELIPVQEVLELLIFMIFWTLLCLSRLGIQLIF